MAKRVRLRGSAPTGNRDSQDSVGYKRPPQHSRFSPGYSGNPGGRAKGVRNLATDVRRTLKGLIKVKEGGRSHKISAQAGMLLVLREKALKGDARALDRLLNLGIKFYNEPAFEAYSLSTDDEAILAAYAQELAEASALSELSRPVDLLRRPLIRNR